MPSRPSPIKLAITLQIVSITCGLVWNIWTIVAKNSDDAERLVGALVANFLLVAPPLFLAYKIYKRRNWARATLAVLVIVSLYPYVTRSLIQLPSPKALFYLSQALIQIIAMILLYLPASNRWFFLDTASQATCDSDWEPPGAPPKDDNL
jgi:hypothetical protein